jgi:hypothetical protein
VEIPGFTLRLARPSRTELFASLLDRAGIEPFASVAWLLVATGIRVDWSPPFTDAARGGAGGWGSVSVRLRMRIDALNRPAMPGRKAHRPARFNRT